MVVDLGGSGRRQRAPDAVRDGRVVPCRGRGHGWHRTGTAVDFILAPNPTRHHEKHGWRRMRGAGGAGGGRWQQMRRWWVPVDAAWW